MAFRQFDYETISDVIMHLRYTAVDGGEKLKTVACNSVLTYIKSVGNLGDEEGLFAAFDLKHDFSDEWNRATNVPAKSPIALSLDGIRARLPFFTSGMNVTANDIYLIASPPLDPLKLGLNDARFGRGSQPGVLVSHDVGLAISGKNEGLKLTIQDADTKIDKLWLLMRYTLE